MIQSESLGLFIFNQKLFSVRMTNTFIAEVQGRVQPHKVTTKTRGRSASSLFSETSNDRFAGSRSSKFPDLLTRRSTMRERNPSVTTILREVYSRFSATRMRERTMLTSETSFVDSLKTREYITCVFQINIQKR